MREGGSELAHDPTEAEGVRPTAQILQFRSREHFDGDRLGREEPGREQLGGHACIGAADANEPELLDDLDQYERDREEDENINYPQRMLMNIIAVVIVTLLIGVGVWLADTIANMEREQDCVLQGRQNCAPIEIAAPIQK